MHRYLLLLVLPLYNCNCFGSATKDTTYIRSYSQFEFNYSNDVYNKTDRYLTQFAFFSYTTPFKLNRYKKIVQNSYSIQQNVYTPLDIFGDTIQRNDRPYSATLALEFNRNIFNEPAMSLFNYKITAGTMGTTAFGKQMQREVHYAVHSRQALGWQYQTTGAPYLNFQAGIQKNLIALKNLDYIARGQINAGTVFNNLVIGQTTRLHLHHNYFSYLNQSTIKTLRLSATIKNELRLVAYDGTLQGGIGSRGNPYTITQQKISPIVYYHEIGFLIGYKHLDISVSKSFLSREFNTGLKHRWMGILFTYLF